MLLIMAVSANQKAFAQLLLQALTIVNVDQQVGNVLLFTVGVMKVQAGQIFNVSATRTLSAQQQYGPSLYRSSSFYTLSANTLSAHPCNSLSAFFSVLDYKGGCRQGALAVNTWKESGQIDNTFPGMWSLPWVTKRNAAQTVASVRQTTPFTVNSNTWRYVSLTSQARMSLRRTQPQRLTFQTVPARSIHGLNFTLNDNGPGNGVTAAATKIRHLSILNSGHDKHGRTVGQVVRCLAFMEASPDKPAHSASWTSEVAPPPLQG